MGLFNLLSRKKPVTEAAVKMIEDIRKFMNNLVLKCDYLKDDYIEEKNKIRELSEIIDSFVPSDEILAAKFEQDILGKITALSSACDSLIAGNPNASISAELEGLASSVTQRKALEK